MSRNAESRFALAPSVSHPRSTFDRNQKIVTSGEVGKLIPFYIDEVLPGDTFQVDTHAVIRFTPMVSCPLDDIVFDTYYFYCPNRIVYDDWIRFMGESDVSGWTTPPTYKVPKIKAPEGGWQNGTIADYFGIPTKVPNISVNALPFRAFAKIYDFFFRDENLQDHVYCPTDAVNRDGVNTGNYVTDMHLGGLVPKANKLHDAFTSCLPNTQKAGKPASIGFNGLVPVHTTYDSISLDDPNVTGANLRFNIKNLGNSTVNLDNANIWPSARMNGSFSLAPGASTDTSDYQANWVTAGNIGKNTDNIMLSMQPNNLYADMAMANFGVTVPELRTAFQVQRFLELLARTGTRYNEAIKAIYDVTVPDYRCMQPEYLGGSRIDINIQQVVNMTAPSAQNDDPLGTIGAYSLTNSSGASWTKSFTEAGFVIGCFVARYRHSYQQSLAKMWTRGEDRTDYFMPVFQNISEQPVYNREVCCTGNDTDGQVFGYQEPFYDYRYLPDRISGLCRTNSESGLDIWHFADYYESIPYLSDEWIAEDSSNIDRCLAVKQATAGFQFYCDILVNNRATRLLPLYSVPGLIDHN